MLTLLSKSPVRFAKRWLLEHHNNIRPLIPNRYFAFATPGGRVYLNIKESPMMLARAFGFFEQEKTAAIQALLQPGQTFLDVGGNKGDFALLAAKIVGKEGQVICIEPEPTNCSWIRRSIDLNGYKNILQCNLALSDHDGEEYLHLGTKSGYHTLLSGAHDRSEGLLRVRVRKLDSLLQELNIRAVNIIKIDVEGAELQVLKGAAETIRANREIILLLDIHNFLGVNSAEIVDYLASFGLTLCQMHPPYNLPGIPDGRIHDGVARRL